MGREFQNHKPNQNFGIVEIIRIFFVRIGRGHSGQICWAFSFDLGFGNPNPQFLEFNSNSKFHFKKLYFQNHNPSLIQNKNRNPQCRANQQKSLEQEREKETERQESRLIKD